MPGWLTPCWRSVAKLFGVMLACVPRGGGRKANGSALKMWAGRQPLMLVDVLSGVECATKRGSHSHRHLRAAKTKSEPNPCNVHSVMR